MTSRLGRLLRPRSLAFVGGAAAELAIDACRSFGFSGDMWAVNPGRELRGLPTFASAAELPAGVDAAFVGVDRHASIDVVRQLAAAGAGATVCHASGFAETGEAGATLQDELVAAAAGMPLLGPNCYGALSAPTGAALWPDVHGLTRCDRGVALLSQSGNIAVSLTMQRRGLDIAWVMTLGNQADVGISEAFEAVVGDDAATGVGLCIEGLDDVDRFVAAAAAARRRGLPVTALKLGTSESSEAIAVTHTASLVGDDAAYGALFARLGVHRVDTLPELLDTLAVLGAVGPLRGNRLVSLSCSGGEAALIADRSRDRDLSFPSFSGDHAARVEAALDGRVAITNPLDYHTFIWGDQDRLTGCFSAALAADAPGSGRVPFDAALLVLDFPADGLDRSRWWPTLQAFSAACAATGTPGVVAASLAENMPADARSRSAELGLAACGDLDTALASLEAAAAWGRQLPVPDASWPVPARGSVLGSRVVSEHEAKPRLAAARMAVPDGVVVSADGAPEAAAGIGFPVVVKAVGSTHKTDAGEVVVGLTDAGAVAAAARSMTADGDGAVMVESCVTGAVAELLVGVRPAPPVGMLLTLGAGGTLAELFDDTASLLLPAGTGEVLEALRSLRVWPLLAGYRGGPPAAVDAVVEAVTALGVLVRDDPSIIEVEINPLVVTPHAAVAVDALMVLADG
ncbi:MAG: acetate--CoA ligase family protein [Acidimicrobiaceae bacterium]|nr:acetate--CoA ligase family protein [Acidimicrobiaceae bacterium]